jgi:hypothetical protein
VPTTRLHGHSLSLFQAARFCHCRQILKVEDCYAPNQQGGSLRESSISPRLLRSVCDGSFALHFP